MIHLPRRRLLIGSCLLVLSTPVACTLGELSDPELVSVEPPGEPPPTIEPTALCSSTCHGDETSAAPPSDLAGGTTPDSPGVGAHRAHIGPSDTYRQVACTDCHVVPNEVGDPGHLDGDNVAELTFSLINPDATFDKATGSCQNLYCHGDAFETLATMEWTSTTPMQCGSCHGIDPRVQRMSGDHKKHIDKGMTCNGCHAGVVAENLAFTDPSLHLNGLHDISMPTGGTYDPVERRCSNLACHENERW